MSRASPYTTTRSTRPSRLGRATPSVARRARPASCRIFGSCSPELVGLSARETRLRLQDGPISSAPYESRAPSSSSSTISATSAAWIPNLFRTRSTVSSPPPNSVAFRRCYQPQRCAGRRPATSGQFGVVMDLIGRLAHVFVTRSLHRTGSLNGQRR
ncbi:hypothetical protein EXIGLDRAFT_317996 [Exidia glandulosa HHB12029]|uniref:Uncharacterized protein n=1 Tax=Exidia glandulosa HHB12029 TaxID=1314781 RepID=A0A165Q1T0_EXIGL|nr:hypothetical protein EXIGLDRAFT_317996 [Exidia glandulosa HHB12029]